MNNFKVLAKFIKDNRSETQIKTTLIWGTIYLLGISYLAGELKQSFKDTKTLKETDETIKRDKEEMDKIIYLDKMLTKKSN